LHLEFERQILRCCTGRFYGRAREVVAEPSHAVVLREVDEVAPVAAAAIERGRGDVEEGAAVLAFYPSAEFHQIFRRFVRDGEACGSSSGAASGGAGIFLIPESSLFLFPWH